jgi:EmrB/QacA subfamily drug resistance transporter
VTSTTNAPAEPGKGTLSANRSGAPDSRRWLALTVIAIAQLMVVLDASIVTIALPHAQADLGISDADRQWIITAYTLAFGGLLLLGGRIADFVGRKRVFLIGLIGFAAASALGGAAQNQGMLFGARALQGAFAAVLAPAALSLITVTFTEPRERAKAFGVYGGISGGGAAIGLILGGVLTEYASWRWCLLVNVPIAIGAALAALPTVHESRAEGDRHYDIPGAVLVTGGLLALVYGFTEAAKPGVGWGATETVALLVAAGVLLVGFVLVELRTAHPLLPMRIVLDRNRGGSFLASLLVGAGLFAMFLFLTYYFQINLGYSPLKSGFAFLPFSGGIIVAAGLASTLLPRTGPKPLMLVGLALATAGIFDLTQLGTTSSWLTHVLPAEVVMSVGLALVFVPLSSLSLFGVEPRDAGVASAMLNTTQQVGGSLGTALLNTLYASAVTGYLASHVPGGTGAAAAQALQFEAFLHGYRVAFVIGGALLAAALIVVAFAVNARRDQAAKQATDPSTDETTDQTSADAVPTAF